MWGFPLLRSQFQIFKRAAILNKVRSFLIPEVNVGAKKYASKPRQLYCQPHMNELPIPCGPWEAHHNQRNSFYNYVLAGGIFWLLLSLIIMVYSGAFYLNWGPPLSPAPPTEMVKDCPD